MAESKSNTLSPAQLHALSFIATREEFGKLSRVIENVARRVGVNLKLPQAPMSFGSSAEIDQKGGHIAKVARSSTRLFALIYSVAALYELVIGLLRRKKLSTLIRSLSSISAIRLASAVSLYSTIYRLLLPRLASSLSSLSPAPDRAGSGAASFSASRRRILNSRALPPFLAGVAATPAMLLEGKGQRRVTISLYALTRAIHGLLGVAGTKGLLTKGMREGRWWWGGHLVFAASNAILLHAYAYDPSTFPAAYSNFILRYSSAYLPSAPQPSLASSWPSRREIVDAVATSSRLHYPSFVSPLLYANSKGYSLSTDVGEASRAALEKIRPILDISSHPGQSRLTCAILHPEDQSCWDVFSSFVKGEFVGANKFFGALAILGTLTRWKKFLKSPDEGIYRAIMSTITSSAFLSLSLGSAWSTICFFQHYLPGSFLPTKRFYVQGFLAGLWVRLVGAQRSTDLGLYTARMAIQTAWDVLVQENKVRNIRNGELLYFGMSMGVLLAIHETGPDAIQSKMVRSALRRVAGPSATEGLETVREVQTSSE